MSRLWSRLLLPRTGVHRNISMELPSLLRLSKLLTATIAAASYNSLKAFGLVSDVNNAVDGLLTMWKCSVLVANVQISDSAETHYVIEQVSKIVWSFDRIEDILLSNTLNIFFFFFFFKVTIHKARYMLLNFIRIKFLFKLHSFSNIKTILWI